MQSNEIAILDFGSQYTHLIARRIRELGVVAHIYPNDTQINQLTQACGIILSGGPKSVLAHDQLEYDSALFDGSTPILGLCYGHQLIAKHFGGTISKGGAREYGIAELTMSNFRPELISMPTRYGGKSRDEQVTIFKDIPQKTTVWMSHGDYVEHLPTEFVSLAHTNRDLHTAMAHSTRPFYGFQFHPEVHHTKDGRQMLHNFVFHICGAEKNWTTADMLKEVQDEIIKQAQNKKVFLLMSGGVDSTVCFALLEKTLGKNRVYGLHIDHGFMRQDESNEVQEALAEIGANNLHIYHAEKEFLQALEGVTDPERKRQIIGDLFLDITERIMKDMGCNEKEWLLGQGTIYPDTIESGGTKHADKIKTHHNRVDRVHEMIKKGSIIEPIKELYKDEVRQLGLTLGLPEHLIYRHPFPGPGLAIRCLCSSGSQEKPTAIEQLNNQIIYKLPIKSVGVQGDERSFAHPAVLLNAPSDRDALRALSPTITNTHRDINRVLIVVGSQELKEEKKLDHSTLHEAYLTRSRLDLLRQIDAVVNEYIMTHPACRHIWQMPVVLVPFGYHHGESIVLRPVESEEAMTVSWATLPEEFLEKVVGKILSEYPIDFVFYDITNKPPGTIEWE